MTQIPMLFTGAMIRAQLAGLKNQTRRVVTPMTVTVNGENWRSKEGQRLFAGLDFSRAEVRTKFALLQAVSGDDAPHDLHLQVPFLHPDHKAAGATWADQVPVYYRVRPVYQVGDLIWTKETMRYASGTMRWFYVADGQGVESVRGQTLDHPTATRWARGICPSIHQPKRLSRMTREIVDVRMQRLQEISAPDSIAEGVECETCSAMGESACHRRGCFSSMALFEQLWNSINEKRGFGWETNPWVIPITMGPPQANILDLEEKGEADARIS